MNPGINPNWLEDHEASVKEREAANALMAKKLGGYKVPEGKDYLKSLQAVGRREQSREETSDLEFAPLIDFLELNMKEQKEAIMSWMMFMGVSGSNFEYKNQCTRDYIVIDRTGRVVSQDAYALWFDQEEEVFQQHMIDMEGMDEEEEANPFGFLAGEEIEEPLKVPCIVLKPFGYHDDHQPGDVVSISADDAPGLIEKGMVKIQPAAERTQVE